jgi:RNA polymerase sigma-70 factor (ECF subfamily)
MDDEFIPTRRSLLNRLKDWDDKESWLDFFNTYWKLIYSVAAKAGLNDAEAQDVVQETVIAVAKKMQAFKYDPAAGSFKSWLRLITRRRIADHFRKEYRHSQPVDPKSALAPATSTGRTTTIERIPDPASLDLDAIWDAEWEQNLMDAAVERVKRRVNPRHYQIFSFCVMKKWPVFKVARTLGVSVGQVYLVKHRIARQIRKEIEYLETKMI